MLILGAPGSGKGTLSSFIETKFGYVHLATGDLLRNEIAKESPLGNQVKEILAQGGLVNDETMMSLLSETLKSNKQPLLLDGFPRTVGQAQLLDKHQPNFFNTILYLDVPEAELIVRITKRLTCPNCHAVYNQVTNPPQDLSICDKCGSRLIQRNDDSSEVFTERLAHYKKQTQPLIKYYGKKIISIDAHGPIEKVQHQIERALT